MRREYSKLLRAFSLAWCLFLPAAIDSSKAVAAASDFDGYGWTEVSPSAEWETRAGLQVAQLGDMIYLMGGRTPLDPAIVPVFGASTIWDDVWESNDYGQTWNRIVAPGTPGHWPARAYFEAVTKGDEIFLLGGQDFKIIEVPGPMGPMQVPVSSFFNDVWSSTDGVNWIPRTIDAPWQGRAGLSSAVLNDDIYVFGGSFNDDPSIIGGPPERVYFDDVWKSSDEGETWELLLEHAPWEPRAGAAVVVKDDYIYLLGGEEGFLCEPFPGCSLPYYNDVWRTQDGVQWDLVIADADWSPRPGHKAAVIEGNIFLFGGFGLPTNPMDVWVSEDGETWEQLSGAPWNAVSPDEIKYDFDVLAVDSDPSASGPAILSFGGDRENFDMSDPNNFMRVDNDVWRFSLPVPEPGVATLMAISLLIYSTIRPGFQVVEVSGRSC